MKCPKCETKLSCGCASCRNNFPEIENKMIESDLTEDGSTWFESCPVCFFKEEVHWWFDEELRQYEKTR